MAKESNSSVAKLQEELKELKASMSQMLTMLGKLTSPSAPSTGLSAPPVPLSFKPTNFMSNMICHNCKGKGHRYRECPSARDPDFTPPQPSRSPVRPPTPIATLLNSKGLGSMAKTQSLAPKANCCLIQSLQNQRTSMVVPHTQLGLVTYHQTNPLTRLPLSPNPSSWPLKRLWLELPIRKSPRGCP